MKPRLRYTEGLNADGSGFRVWASSKAAIVVRPTRPDLTTVILGPMELPHVHAFSSRVRAWYYFARAIGVAALLALVSCATPVSVQRTPDVCPALPERPAQADVTLPEFLPVLDPAVMATKDPDKIASEVLRVRVDSAAQYQACRANNDALATWARSHSQE